MRFAKRASAPVLDYATPTRPESIWTIFSRFTLSRRLIATALACVLTGLLCYVIPPTSDWRINIAIYGVWFAVLVWRTDGGENWRELFL